MAAVIDRAAGTGMKLPFRRKAVWFGGRLGRSALVRPTVIASARTRDTGVAQILPRDAGVSLDQRVGTIVAMVPSARNVMRSMVTSRLVPLPAGTANRW